MENPLDTKIAAAPGSPGGSWGRIPGGRGGFTFIEIVAALVIILILGVFISTRVMETEDLTLISHAEKLKSHVRYAQMRAMGSSSVWGINSTGSAYWLFRDGDITKKAMLPGENVDEDGDGDSTTVTLPFGMTVDAGVVSFDSWGTPYTDAGGTAPQVGDRTATISYGAPSRSMTITQETGFIP